LSEADKAAIATIILATTAPVWPLPEQFVPKKSQSKNLITIAHFRFTAGTGAFLVTRSAKRAFAPTLLIHLDFRTRDRAQAPTISGEDSPARRNGFDAPWNSFS
jgi:hypothetical protein